MDTKKLIRDHSKIHSCLVEMPDGRLITKKKLCIYSPVRFEERKLSFVGLETSIVGIYGIVLDNTYYGISLVNAMIKIEPTATLKVEIDGDLYYEFSFDPGAVVMSSVNLVKNDQLVYKIYDELISKANIPWYIKYNDLGKIFDTANYHAGANIGGNHEVTELLVSLIARNDDDRYKYYRQTIKNLNEEETKPPAYVSLRSVIYSATNTTNKLAGSYFGQGVVSALVTPAEKQEKLEKLLML